MDCRSKVLELERNAVTKSSNDVLAYVTKHENGKHAPSSEKSIDSLEMSFPTISVGTGSYTFREMNSNETPVLHSLRGMREKPDQYSLVLIGNLACLRHERYALDACASRVACHPS